MAKMHWCTCLVNLAGQGLTFVRIEKQFPVSWPELQVLMLVHGEENITDIKPIGISEVHPPSEKERLAGKYGFGAVERVFPGRSFRMELLMPAETDDLPKVGFDGIGDTAHGIGDTTQLLPVGRQADDDDHTGPLEPPVGAPVFKQGKHQPPLKHPDP